MPEPTESSPFDGLPNKPAPPPVPEEILERRRAAAEEQARREKRAAERLSRRLIRAGIAGGVFAAVLALLQGESRWIFPVLCLLLGGGAACVIVWFRQNHLLGMFTYAGPLIGFAITASGLGWLKYHPFVIFFLWIFLIAFGAAIAFWAELDRAKDDAPY